MHAIQFLWCWFPQFDIGSTHGPLLDIFLYSHHLSAWYCCYWYCKENFFLGHSLELKSKGIKAGNTGVIHSETDELKRICCPYRLIARREWWMKLKANCGPTVMDFSTLRHLPRLVRESMICFRYGISCNINVYLERTFIINNRRSGWWGKDLLHAIAVISACADLQVMYMIVDVSHNQIGWFRVFKEEQVANEFHLLWLRNNPGVSLHNRGLFWWVRA